MSITRKLVKLILTLLTLPLLVAFVPDETVAGDGSTSNADRWICDFYDSTGDRQCGSIFGTGSSNDSTSMVHIRRGET